MADKEARYLQEEFSETERTYIFLRFVRGMKKSEIAELTGIPMDIIERRFSDDFEKRLHKCLKKDSEKDAVNIFSFIRRLFIRVKRFFASF